MDGSTRVVLVDDSPEFTEVAREVLGSDERFEVVGVAADGDEAIELVRELQPDLVLMDIEMPRRDGVSATREIRDCCPSAHVVMLTGRNERADEVGSGAAGAIGFLRKEQLTSPRLPDELIALVELA